MGNDGTNVPSFLLSDSFFGIATTPDVEMLILFRACVVDSHRWRSFVLIFISSVQRKWSARAKLYGICHLLRFVGFQDLVLTFRC